ncbi:MAG TPA: sensor histidine kinase [Microlunatus sp.]|nr:sensor histidine kinase [Microlunatus sp.]
MREQSLGPRHLVLDLPLGIVVGLLTWMSVMVARFAGPGKPPWARGDGEWEGPPPWTGQGSDFPAEGQPIGLIVLGILLLVTGLALRRIRPRAGYAAVVVGVAVGLLAGVPVGPILLAPIIAVATLAQWFEPARWLPWSVALVPMTAAALWPPDGRGFTDPNRIAGAIFVLVLFGLAAMVGTLRRVRQETRRRDREADLRRSAYEERLRIAREVHDLIGHSLSVINMQAGVALHVLPKRPEQAEESLRAIRQTSKDALAELRSTLAVFRDPDRGEPKAPEPGLGRLEDLITAMRQAGRTIELTVEGDVDDLPPTVDHTAYRIVQEALTNVARHAGGAAAEVTVAREPRRLSLAVVDHGPPVRSGDLVEGHGISGMRERARAVGGTLTVRPQPGGGVAVRAELPIREGER